MKNLLLISSTYHAHGEALAHARKQVQELLSGLSSVLFIPYARPGGLSLEEYTAKLVAPMKGLGFELRGIESYDNPRKAVEEAEAVYIGGGNTFLLLRELYRENLLEPIRARVESGMPYMGTSAGSNVAGKSIGTSNDMPIVYPPSFMAMALVPFNLNPHYPRQEDAQHMGETREDRIREFHLAPENTQAVMAIREDSMLSLKGEQLILLGETHGRLFRQGQEPQDMPPGSNLSFLL